jgi:virulence-associated protein VagC
MVGIKEFEYVDHLRILWQENENEAYNTGPNDFEWLQKYHVNNENSPKILTQTEVPTKTVRGLAAKHDIFVGDIVISIPLYSLLSVPTTIDHDPVLSRILGPKAREQYGWTDTLEYEVPLLVIAVLYHRSLGMESPLSRYIDVLLGTPTDFPFLWSDQQLRDYTDKIGFEVIKLARGIKKDLHEMYNKIMGKLVTEHSDLFSPPNENSVEEWMYSYKNFQWAFSLVISRHHYLPIQDLDYRKDHSEMVSGSNEVVQTKPDRVEITQSDSTVSEVVPPANQPTDSWVELAKNEEKVVDDAVVKDQDRVDDDDIIEPSGFFKHSFLAPLADMINFGPPCLTGSYNLDEHVFELIATCPFKAGQEVTFYYSSECADVIIANYAFLHPLVPPCATIDEVKEKSEEWKSRLMDAEAKVWKLHRQVDVLKGEILALESQLQSCESGEDNKVNGKKEYPFSHSKNVGDETTSSDSDTSPSHQKLRKEGQPSRNHEVGVRGRMHEPSRLEFDEQIMEELG